MNEKPVCVWKPLCGKKIRDSIRSITKKSDDYDEKYIKIKFNSDQELVLNKTIEIPSMTILRFCFYERSVFMKLTNIICKFS